MATIVQKFGGTSVAEPNRVRRCAERVADARRRGDRVVVVVSAMGHTTDELISLAHDLNPSPSRREMDMLMSTGEQVSIALMAMALHAMGIDATSMTGGQLGILTTPAHRAARIQSIDAARIRARLDAGEVVVAAGFQGVTECGEITTLGRGGSDTTAVALAAALDITAHGGACEIYTDVDGVYTADPRIVASATKLARISYEEMLELAALGAAVMHPRAVMFGQNFGVPIHVRHSQRPDTGTLIVKETSDMEDTPVVGVALKEDLGRVSLRRIPNRLGVQASIFREIAHANLMVDDIMQTEFGDTANISFTVEHADLAEVKTVVGNVLERLGTGELAVEIGLAKVSAVGTGMKSHTGVASTMFQALGDAKIPIHNITTSEIKISCIVPREHAKQAANVVHTAFGLDGGDATHPIGRVSSVSAP